jgi:hypothetical protein
MFVDIGVNFSRAIPPSATLCFIEGGDFPSSASSGAYIAGMKCKVNDEVSE